MTRTDGRGVGRAFAQGRPAKNSNGQLFTDGHTVYSYGHHWPIAAWRNGELHINDGRYSVTTSKHRSFVVGGLTREYPGALDKAIHHTGPQDMPA